MNLDAAQIRAIRHKDGPALVLAGPGSGKTTVITRRIRCLIDEYHIPPQHILVITFSRAAAAEMKERFYRLVKGQALPVTFGTFHAIYFQILKHAYGYTAQNVVREEQRLQFIREYIHRLRLEFDDENDFIQSLLGEISLVKNTMADLEHYYSATCSDEVFRKIYRAYQEFLYRNRYLDFDDMLIYTKELLEQREDIRKAWQNKFRYILIDEFQDINLIQYQIVRMLAQPANHLFIVGDDDQSIYRFRGAKPEIMLHFEKDYPGTKKILLDVNYRCGAQIVRFAGNLISHNQTRFDKKIRANAASGIRPVVKAFPSQREQNRFVIDEIQRLHTEGGIPYSDIAVLFRTNAQPRLLIQQLFAYNMPFVSREHLPNIYDHWIARDLFTYIRLAMGDRSRASFLRIMNRPKRYLSRESLPYESVAFDVWEEYYQKQEWVVQRLQKLESDLRVISRMRPYTAVNYIRKGIAYEDFLTDFAEFRKINAEDLFDILDEIQEDSRSFETYTEWFSHIEKMQAEWKEQSAQNKKNENAVQLMTLHSSKGLEFEAVFIVDVDEKIMPYKKAVLDADLEEERRMFYVGMTRAKTRLYLLCSGKIHNKEMEASRYLTEIFQDRKE